MQAASAEAPFSSPEYLFEVKWDGLRCMVFRDPDGRVRLQDRAFRDLTADLPEVVAAARRIPPGSVIDGELVATDNDGRPDYPRLRERLSGGAALRDRIPTAYLAFDALYLEGKPLVRQPVLKRRARLAKSVEAGGHLFVPDHIEEDGVELFEACLERGLEGVVAKHRQSPYVPGQEPVLAQGQGGQVGRFRGHRLDGRRALRRAGRRLPRGRTPPALRHRGRWLRRPRCAHDPPGAQRPRQRRVPPRASADHGSAGALGAT